MYVERELVSGDMRGSDKADPALDLIELALGLARVHRAGRAVVSHRAAAGPDLDVVADRIDRRQALLAPGPAARSKAVNWPMAPCMHGAIETKRQSASHRHGHEAEHATQRARGGKWLRNTPEMVHNDVEVGRTP